MTRETQDKDFLENTELNFFDYKRLANEAFQKLLQDYPELGLLSSRELDVFEQLLTDKTLTQIAEDLYISYSVVHFHYKNIYKKLKITNRRQLLITYKDLCQ